MVVRRERKRRKFRGHRTYGYGKHKRARGAGTRGGRGKAGMHKQKWTYTVKYEPGHFGKKGFKPPLRLYKKPEIINLKEIEISLEKWKKMELVEEEEGMIKVDGRKIGFEKVLGTGKLSKPVIIVAKKFSALAKKKIEEVGGKAVEI